MITKAVYEVRDTEGFLHERIALEKDPSWDQFFAEAEKIRSRFVAGCTVHGHWKVLDEKQYGNKTNCKEMLCEFTLDNGTVKFRISGKKLF
ncbi:MAG: hypothetical protein WC444_05225 [Candidatus Paceibacterota bacterium]